MKRSRFTEEQIIRVLREQEARILAGWAQATASAAQFRAFFDAMRNRFIAYLMERFESFVDDRGVAIPSENHYLLASR